MESKFYFWGPLLFHCKLEEDQIKKILNICKKDDNLNYQKNLAGHIKNEFLINKTDLQLIIQSNLKQFYKCHKFYYNIKKEKDFNIFDAWVNYMGPGDFNPPHTHGGDFSAVIFLKIPKEISNEFDEHTKADIKSFGPGSISFIAGVGHQNTDEGQQSVWKKDFFPNPGEMFIFPADLLHMVYPFKSNVERITVAYNMNYINVEKN